MVNSQFNARNIFILGAGASYGSEENKNLVPPLAQNLFDKLCIQFPQTKDLTQGFENIFRNDFEKGMTELGNKLPHNLVPFQRILAAFFFNFELHSTSTYLQLLSKLRPYIGTTAFITLNYELLLFKALNASGIFPVIDMVPLQNQALVCIPHGICHLFCEGIIGDANGVSMCGIGVKINGPIKPIYNPQEYYHRIQNDAFPPVMSYFEPKKETLSGSDFILGQRAQYEQLISKANKIVIIGAKIRDYDTHLWKSLSETKATVLYCSGNDASGYQEYFKHNSLRKNDVILNDYFQSSLDKIINFIK